MMNCWGMMTHRGCLTTRQVSEAAVGPGEGVLEVYGHNGASEQRPLCIKAFACPMLDSTCQLLRLTVSVPDC